MTVESDGALPVLHAKSQEWGITLNRRQVQQFARFRSLLLAWNHRFNITAIDEPDEVEVRHFVDSVAGLPLLPNLPFRMIDVGSGGGFPGVPLAIARPDASVTLLEATGKKCRFLQAVVDELSLAHTVVVNTRAELQAQVWGFREQFDIATARSVAALPALLELTLPFVKLGGHVLCWKKGDIEAEERAALRARKLLGGDPPDLHRFEAMGLETHVIVDVRKTSPTPARFPRRPGYPARQPL